MRPICSRLGVGGASDGELVGHRIAAPGQHRGAALAQATLPTRWPAGDRNPRRSRGSPIAANLGQNGSADAHSAGRVMDCCGGLGPHPRGPLGRQPAGERRTCRGNRNSHRCCLGCLVGAPSALTHRVPAGSRSEVSFHGSGRAREECSARGEPWPDKRRCSSGSAARAARTGAGSRSPWLRVAGRKVVTRTTSCQEGH